jgi:hypothetical protein
VQVLILRKDLVLTTHNLFPNKSFNLAENANVDLGVTILKSSMDKTVFLFSTKSVLKDKSVERVLNEKGIFFDFTLTSLSFNCRSNKPDLGISFKGVLLNVSLLMK